MIWSMMFDGQISFAHENKYSNGNVNPIKIK